MSVSVSSAITNSTSRPWHGRIRRIGVVLLIITAWLTVGRFITYHIAGSSYSFTHEQRCHVEEHFSTRDDAYNAIMNRHQPGSSEEGLWTITESTDEKPSPEDGFSEHNGTFIVQESNSSYVAYINDNDSCSWTDDFNASVSDTLVGYFLGLLALAVASAICCVIAILAWDFGRYVWNGTPPIPECRNRDCPCIEHHATGTFDEETKTWNYPKCSDGDCSCNDHA